MRKKVAVSEENILKFERKMRRAEREESTIEVYLRTLRKFAGWARQETAERERTIGRKEVLVDKETAIAWKGVLSEQGYSPVTVNSMLAAVNQFFECMGCAEYKVRYLRVQRRIFRSSSRELTRQEYQRLVECAYQAGDERLALLMETICATGIRVSEVKYITLETVKDGVAEVALKGKIRTILIPNKLCRKLIKYAKRQKISAGEIFLTRAGKSLSRKLIWAEMKRCCAKAGVAKSKVFPHNLRHLFARTFYRICRDVVKLADVLGHSSIETTRIYLMSTGKEYARQLDKLGLVC